MKKNIKMLFIYVFTVVFIVPTSICAIDAPQVSVILDNEYIVYDEYYGIPYIDDNNRTMVPLRLTLESFGAEVEWVGELNLVVIKHEDIVVNVPIGEKFIYKNEEKIENDTYAVNKKSRIYLPIRIVMEAFGCEVLWDGDNRVVIINSDHGPYKDKANARFDLREEGNVTSVKDQKELGTCWAFAALGSIESSLLKQTGEIYDFSEDNVSLKHGYNLTQDQGGDFMLALAYFARWSGPIMESDDVYGDGISSQDVKSVKHLQEAYFIPADNFETIKDTVKNYGGVHTSIYWEYRDVENEKYYNKNTYSLNYNGKEETNHDVVIVGWDDEYPKENFIIQPDEDGAFICKNSFGTDFGEEGYFYISYYDAYIGKQNMVYSKIEDNDNYDKIYQADWLGLVGKLGFNTDTGYFSNVYETGNQQEELKAVSFYTTGINSKYEVYLVENFTGKDDLKNMIFLESGFREYSGYYTINLKQPITLDKNKKFAVIVKMTTPGTKFPIAAEFDRDVKWLGKVDLSDGEGYISYDGEIWEDTEEVLQSNVCLKAFTDIVVDQLVKDTAEESESQPVEQSDTENVSNPDEATDGIESSNDNQPTEV
ncbi:lectin like domain-containing protein [Vallitalea guaymasensis]|nr:lectin like domain-containing protein [Vallitalea guaymasensis]